MAEERSVSPSAQPAVATEEDRDELLKSLFALPFEQQVEVFRAIAPRILARAEGSAGARTFLDSLKTATATEQLSPSEAGEGKVPADRVAGDILRQPVGDQRHILNIAAPRIVANVIGSDRGALLDEIAREVADAESGKATEFDGNAS